MKLPAWSYQRMAPLPKHSARFAGLRERRFQTNDEADLSNIGGVAMAVAAIIIAAVVTLTLLSNLFPTYSASVASISENVSTADWGDETANGIGPVFAMLVSLGGLFAIVGLVFLAYKLRGASVGK